MKTKHRIGALLVAFGLFMIIFSGKLASAFTRTSKTVSSDSSGNYWYQVVIISPGSHHSIVEWTCAVVIVGLVICGLGTSLLFRGRNNDANQVGPH